ncbi:MAG: hypothetical protein M3Q99_15910 [Acidobacteriota bacterium]|nr:hypothetical protein [Acidobacteriota bacterium]
MQRGIKLHAFIVAAGFMIGLNALLLNSGGETFRKPGFAVFHIACISIGVYTLVVLLLPKTDEVWE